MRTTQILWQPLRAEQSALPNAYHAAPKRVRAHSLSKTEGQARGCGEQSQDEHGASRPLPAGAAGDRRAAACGLSSGSDSAGESSIKASLAHAWSDRACVHRPPTCLRKQKLPRSRARSIAPTGRPRRLNGSSQHRRPRRGGGGAADAHQVWPSAVAGAHTIALRALMSARQKFTLKKFLMTQAFNHTPSPQQSLPLAANRRPRRRRRRRH